MITMRDFNIMIDELQLCSIETEINKQVDSIKNHPDRLKVAIFLCMLSESGFKALSDIDTQGFVDALNERLSAIHKEYDEKLSIVISQLKEDGNVLGNLEHAETNLEEIKSKAEAAVNLFESELKKLVTANDKKPICEK